LICIKPAEEAVLNLAVALPIVFGKVTSKLPRIPGSSGAPHQGDQHENLDRIISGFMAAMTEPANAVVYCQYVEYPAGCTVRAGVVLRPRPVARAVATPGVGRVGTPTNRGGPVDRVGRR
jgi:hypothetical protein